MKKQMLFFVLLLSVLLSSCAMKEPEFSETTDSGKHIDVSFDKSGFPILPQTETTFETEISETLATTHTQPITPPDTVIYFSAPILTPSEDYPPEAPLPSLSTTDDRKVAAFHVLPNGDVWVMYTVRPFTLTIINELCSTSNGGVTWNRVSHAWHGFPIDMFVIDEDHMIVLTDSVYMGYGFYILENNGMDVATQYTSSQTFKSENEPDCDFLFPTEFFSTGNKNEQDLGFYKSVSAYYVEPIDETSCKIVLECTVNGETIQRTAIYDVTGVHATE